MSLICPVSKVLPGMCWLCLTATTLLITSPTSSAKSLVGFDEVSRRGGQSHGTSLSELPSTVKAHLRTAPYHSLQPCCPRRTAHDLWSACGPCVPGACQSAQACSAFPRPLTWLALCPNSHLSSGHLLKSSILSSTPLPPHTHCLVWPSSAALFFACIL